MRRAALTVLCLLVLTGCAGTESPAPPPAPSAAPTSNATEPERGPLGEPIVTAAPFIDEGAPPPDEWVVTTDLARTDADMIDVTSEVLGTSDLQTARDYAYYVCTSLRYDPSQSFFEPLDAFTSIEQTDRFTLAQQAQGYCLDTVGV